MGVNFFRAFSPERINPGNARYKVRDIPKVVGGVTPECTRVAALLYRQIIANVFEGSSPRVAEALARRRPAQRDLGDPGAGRPDRHAVRALLQRF